MYVCWTRSEVAGREPRGVGEDSWFNSRFIFKRTRRGIALFCRGRHFGEGQLSQLQNRLQSRDDLLHLLVGDQLSVFVLRDRISRSHDLLQDDPARFRPEMSLRKRQLPGSVDDGIGAAGAEPHPHPEEALEQLVVERGFSDVHHHRQENHYEAHAQRQKCCGL
jgi:hypothetical protein